MTDILVQLHDASWRGISFPVMNRDFGFQQAHEEHRFIFRDEQLIESLGSQNPTYRYSIPFREDIVKGPFKNLFTSVYPDFLQACLDRTNGLLDDPFHGPVQCKVVSLAEHADVDRRDGIDVDVEWITSPDEDFDRQELGTLISTLQGAQHTQDYLSKQAAELDPETKQKIADFNKGSENGKLNPLDVATGALNQVEVAGNKVQASFGDVALRAEKLDDSLRRVGNPDLHPTRMAARRLQLSAIDLGRAVALQPQARGRRIAIYQVPASIGKLALAGKLHNSVQDLLKLNPSIARGTTVSGGTQVAYFAS